jgi:hypothetical protein
MQPKPYRTTGGLKGKALDAAVRKWIATGTPPGTSPFCLISSPKVLVEP